MTESAAKEGCDWISVEMRVREVGVKKGTDRSIHCRTFSRFELVGSGTEWSVPFFD
jgi:hypothetical protein